MTISVTSQNLNTALALAAGGMSVFPCQSGGPKSKQPMPFVKWREASCTDAIQIRNWWRKWPEAAIGLDLAKCGMLVIDADRHGEADGVEAFGNVMAEHGFDPDTAPLVATPNEGNHHFFRQPAGVAMGNNRGTLPDGVDVRGAGGYVIAPGTVMADGRCYELHGDLASAPELPEWLVKIITSSNKPGIEQYRSYTPPAGQHVQPSETSEAEIAELLTYIPADCGYHDWLQVLMAVHAATGGAGFALADEWSARSGSKYPGSKDLLKKWRSFKSQGVTLATLAELARQHGADLSAIAIKHKLPENVGDAPSNAAAARRLIEAHDGTIHDAETGEVVEEDVAPHSPVPLIQYPAGLVGDIARWIVQTARRPQPELAIGAALTIVGTAAGRQFSGPTRSGTHLYVLGLAPTGTGKDHPLQQIGRIMTAAKLGQHLGPSEFISMPAVIKFLMRRPLSVCAMDEFGDFMKRINSKRASGFEASIAKIIRTMWSSSFAPYATPEWAGRDSDTIFAPSMSLYGASTPEQFYSAMEGAAAENGTLNRFLLIQGQPRPAEIDPDCDPSIVPAAITDPLRTIYLRSGDLAVTYRNDALTDPAANRAVRYIPWCADGSRDRYMAFSAEIEGIIQSDPSTAPFYARTAEMALRVATIVAIGRGDDDQVRISDLEFGIHLARQSVNLMAVGAADYMSDNENQANAQKVVRAIKARGGTALYRDILRSLQSSVRARDLRDLLTLLCEECRIEKQEIKHPNGPPTYRYKIIQ